MGIGQSAQSNRRSIRETEPADLQTVKVVKVLMLGAGESGKSTVVKQMLLHYGTGFTERMAYKDIVLQNTLESMLTILSKMKVYRKSQTHYAENEAKMNYLIEIGFSHITTPTTEVLDAIRCLWTDPAVQKFYRERHFYIIDSAE
jgi:hypothetical protein